jgi:hypothetical protein
LNLAGRSSTGGIPLSNDSDQSMNVLALEQWVVRNTPFVDDLLWLKGKKPTEGELR